MAQVTAIQQKRERTIRRRRAPPRPLLPPPAPLTMPLQCYKTAPKRLAGGGDELTLPRLAIIAATLIATGLFAAQLYRVVDAPNMTSLQAVFLALSTVAFAWVAFGTATAVIGFVRLRSSGSANTLDLAPAARPKARCALLFPVYHEDMAAVAATIEMLARDLDRADAAGRFDVFVLSDSRTPESREVEAAAVRLAADRLDGVIDVFFRNRNENVDRKSGNVRDWVERFGAAYETFVVFDADSVMSAETLLRLVATMEREPQVGLVQTVPRLLPGETRATCLAAASSALIGPVAAAGLAVWQSNGGNYWGHNAIVRTRAFADAAGLSHLPGRPPFGGMILSHDFVEAALLRRAGWDVHLVTSADGSWEGSPARLSDVLARDRRWAQGNLQHLRLLTTRGLPWISRMHLFTGAYAYLASALWAASLLVGIVLAIQSRLLAPAYFGTEPTLFPLWPRFDPEAALPLLAATMAVVFLPKLLGLLEAMSRRRKGMRATWRLVGATAIETLHSALVAPILMAAQTTAVIAILAHRDGGWPAQLRAGREVPFETAVQAHAGKAVAGGILWVAAAAVSTALAAWMAPVAIGLLLAPVTEWWTSRPPGPRLAALLAEPVAAPPFDLRQRVDAWRAMLAATDAGRRA